MAHLSHLPKRHLDGFGRFCKGPKCYAVQCIVNGEETPKTVPSLWDFVIPPKDRATAIGNIHKKLVKIARVVREIASWTDRQTDSQTNT